MINVKWKEAHIGIEGDNARIAGVPIWKRTWKRVEEEPVNLSHPSHPNEKHPFWIYEVVEGNKTLRFAATELSAGVWGFYVPA